MSDAAALRTRLEDLASAIAHHQEIIRDLEKTRTAVHRDLNAILDPMARLPLEISSDIFTRCLPAIPRADPLTAPMVLLKVCNSWSNIALSTSALWTSIQIEFPRAAGFEHLFDAWLKHAGTRATSISLRGPLPQAEASVLNQHALRVQKSQLYFSSETPLKQITTSFPCLTALTIARDDRDLDCPLYFSYNPTGCAELIRAAPNLMECNFERVYYSHSPPINLTAFTHTSLRHLRLGIEADEYSGIFILSYFTLPALQTLYIPGINIPLDAIFSFLTRSSPPLQSLYMASSIDSWSAQNLASLFTLVPSLAHLEISSEEEFEFLPALATSPNLLPNLRTLAVREFIPDQYEYENLVSLLFARRAAGPSQLQSFWLLWSECSPEDKPDDEIITALRQLVEGGMHIHIGTADTNFV
ncbi:hypothetical protein DFH09DRAFT_1382092 [Mycena vulgaris]|nr:hypothetical protein DFH09DRAFT_1382092 [Mycena vulgaris]